MSSDTTETILKQFAQEQITSKHAFQFLKRTDQEARLFPLILKKYEQNRISYQEAYSLFKARNSQNFILSGEILTEDLVTFFKAEFNPNVFLLDSPTDFTSQKKELFEIITTIYKSRIQEKPRENVKTQLDRLENYRSINEIQEEIRRQMPSLRKIIELYAYVPELFWLFIPTKKDGSFYKNSVLSLWDIQIREEGYPTHYGIYIKMDKRPRLEVRERLQVRHHCNGLEIVRALELANFPPISYEILIGKGPAKKETKRISLKEKIRHKDTYLRLKAAKSLKSLKKVPRELIPALIHAIEDPEEVVSLAVISFLGGCGAKGKEAIPKLYETSKSKAKEISFASIVALEELGETEKLLPILIQQMGKFTGEMQQTIIEIFKKIHPSINVIPFLQSALSDKSIKRRINAILVLKELKDIEIIPALVLFLLDPHQELSTTAQKTLVEFSKNSMEKVVKPLNEILETEEDPQRLMIILKTLNQIGKKANIFVTKTRLFQLLEKPDIKIRNELLSLCEKCSFVSLIFFNKLIECIKTETEAKPIVLERVKNLFHILAYLKEKPVSVVKKIEQFLEHPDLQIFAIFTLGYEKKFSDELIDKIYKILKNENSNRTYSYLSYPLNQFIAFSKKGRELLMPLLKQRQVY